MWSAGRRNIRDFSFPTGYKCCVDHCHRSHAKVVVIPLASSSPCRPEKARWSPLRLESLPHSDADVTLLLCRLGGRTTSGPDRSALRSESGRRYVEELLARQHQSLAAGTLGRPALVGTAWSIARLTSVIRRLKPGRLVAALAKEVITSFRELSPADIARLSWAFAKLGFRDRRFFKQLGNNARKSLGECSPRDLSNLAWAFATVEVRDHKLFRGIADQVVLRRAEKFDAQSLANIAWSYGSIGIKHRLLFGEIATASFENLHEFTPQGIATLSWAFGAVEVVHEALLDDIAREVSSKHSQKLNPQDMSNLVWAFASLRVKHGYAAVLFEGVATRAAEMVVELPPVSIVNIAWAYTVIHRDDTW